MPRLANWLYVEGMVWMSMLPYRDEPIQFVQGLLSVQKVSIATEWQSWVTNALHSVQTATASIWSKMGSFQPFAAGSFNDR
jgi:hypothetical protein